MAGHRWRAVARARSVLLAAAAAALVAPFGTTPPAAADPADPQPVVDPTALVNPLIGTANGGNVFPGAVLPFGMFSFSPENSRNVQTRTAAPGGYLYSATKIRGFSVTHLSGTGCAGASGDIPFFPYAGAVTTSPSADIRDAVYASTFSHANEAARPGFYSVTLDSGARAELTATTRTGSGRFTFPAGKPATMLVRTSNSELVSTDATVRVDAAARTVSGSVTSGNFCGYINPENRRSYYTLHFRAEFDQPFTGFGTWTDGTVTPGSSTASGGTTFGPNGFPVPGKGSGAYLEFASGSVVNVRVGISYVSDDNALANLRAENRGSFDSLRARAGEAWRSQLNRIRIGGGTPQQRTTFYTALYHALLHPNVFSDVTGEYWGLDRKPHRVSGRQRAQYANFSGWDVYRSQVQLVTLLEPDIGSDIAQSLLNQANQNGGTWDRWTHNSGGTHIMAGDPSVPALAGILAFGGRDFDVRGALRSLVTAATVPTPADLSSRGKPVMSVGQRPSLDKYLALHYVPAQSNAWGGAGETLEDATADFALAQLAGTVGDERTWRQFVTRSQYWQNVFNPQADPSGGYITNRNEDGSWRTSSPGSFDGFAEGTSAQYTWMVQHNVAGLVQALGGTAAAVTRLDAFFHNPDGSWNLTDTETGVHSDLTNEPSLNVPYLYNYVGQAYKTQQTVRQVLTTLWSTEPGGIPGNDDLGEMSSWYVFSALGLYPQVPSRGELVLTGPLFPVAFVERDRGRSILIRARQAATDAPYVQSLRVNGLPSNRAWLPESFVDRGGLLDFTLGTTPNPSWGAAAAPPSWRFGEVPYAVTAGPNQAVIPQGTSGEFTVSAFRLSAGLPALRFAVSPPTGLTADPPSGTITVDPATGTGTASVTIRVDSGTPDGRYTVPITVSSADGSFLPRLAVRIIVGQPGSFAVLRNNVGISDDASTHDEADFDGGGVSFSRQALAAAGLVGGAPATVDGLAFTWPNLPAGEPDNIAAPRAVLTLAGVPATATRLSFVGSASNGDQKGTATLTYTDGTTQEIDLSFSDWTLGGGGGSPQFGNLVVAKTPYRNVGGGDRETVFTYMFATAPVTLAAGKRLAGVTLPDNTEIHVFAVASG
jgi:predicted alpha-1,2-mannosidase